MGRRVRDRLDELERGRQAFARRAWAETHDLLVRAHEQEPLDAQDLELLSMTVYMLGCDDDSVAWLERAHRRHLEDGETLRAVRSAAWIGLNLASRGDVGPASGWLGRAQRLVAAEGECAERGWLLLPRVFQHEAAGDFAASAAVAEEAVRIGERFGDRDLFALAVHSQGHALIRNGRVREGLALLDEAMVAVTAEELSPIVTGIVYCGVILACQEVYEVRRAREWTRALADWWALQPEMVAFTGRCLVHRAEILQLDGSWRSALEEAHRAGERFVETGNPAAGLARYREGELLRLQGDFARAEEAYREASTFGWEPLPGLAQLRLAQGRTDAAVSAIRRAESATTESLERARLLPAFVEIMLAAGDVESARRSCLELEELATGYESAMLGAMVAHARRCRASRGGPGPRGARLVAEGGGDVARARRPVRDRAHACAGRRRVPPARRRGGRSPRARRARRASSSASARSRISRGSRRRTSRHGLSNRELEVLRLVAAGKTNREIAASLVISEHTVARHLQNIFAKLGLSSRAAATAFAFEHDLV